MKATERTFPVVLFDMMYQGVPPNLWVSGQNAMVLSFNRYSVEVLLHRTSVFQYLTKWNLAIYLSFEAGYS